MRDFGIDLNSIPSIGVTSLSLIRLMNSNSKLFLIGYKFKSTHKIMSRHLRSTIKQML